MAGRAEPRSGTGRARGGGADARGFAYVEALAAVVILAFGILAIAPTFLLAARENASASDLTYASTSAQDKVEELKRMHYSLLASGSDVLRHRDVGFNRAWTVERNVPYPRMTTVTVTVTPRRGRNFGANRVVRIRFYRVPT